MSDKIKNPQSESTGENTISMPTASAEIVALESGFVALSNNALEIINENLKNQPLMYQLFDIIKSPSGGATAFTVPGLSGDKIEKELTGIILGYTTPRAY
jgi:hypothetical protein